MAASNQSTQFTQPDTDDKSDTAQPARCLRCGEVLTARRCKIQCPRCGYTEDCADAGLIDYDRVSRTSRRKG